MNALRLLAVGIVLGGAATLALAPAHAGSSTGDTLMNNLGDSIFNSATPCPLLDLPTLESFSPIPRIFDLEEHDTVPVFCQVQVMRNGKPVKNARGTYIAELFSTQDSSGFAHGFQVDGGTFRTNAQGIDTFDFEIPTQIFADGFESGDVSAWSYTRTDFTTRKKATDAKLSCNTAASR